MKKIALLLLAGSVFVFNSCTKRGNTGPQGPQGPQGNANVIGTDPFNVTSWSAVYTPDSAYVASFTDQDITQSVADHGVVEVFLLEPSDGTWRNLPVTINGWIFYSKFSNGGFDIYYGDTYGYMPQFPGSWTFRTVVIAPSQKQAHPNTNWKDYNEVMKVLAADNAAANAANTNVSASH